MKTKVFLRINQSGKVTATKGFPSLTGTEVAFGLTLNIPDEVFREPLFEAEISIDSRDIITPSVAVEVEHLQPEQNNDEYFAAKKGNVIYSKTQRCKSVVTEDSLLPAYEYEFVCEAAHQDGDYSYLCTSPYCRCRS